MKNKIVILFPLLVLLAGAVCLSCSKSASPDPRIKELEAEIQKLKAGDKSLDSAKKAVRELKKVNSLIEMGISYPDYNKSLIDTKPAFDEDLADIPESDLKTNLQAIMDIYIDAGKFWNLCLQHYDSDTGESTIKDAEIEPFKKYNIEVQEWVFDCSVKKESVATIWACANGKYIAANELIKQKENKQ